MAKAKKLQNCMESGRILLRPWLESDAEALFKYASDPEVGPHAGWPPHKNVKESLEIIRTLFHNDTTWAIVLKETDEPVGAIGYGPSCECNLPAREDEPLIGYWVGKPYWNQGICTEALQLMLNHISKSTGIPSLISGHFTDNPASGRVMEKCGFTPTGETCIDESQYMGKDRPIRVLRWERPDLSKKIYYCGTIFEVKYELEGEIHQHKSILAEIFEEDFVFQVIQINGAHAGCIKGVIHREFEHANCVTYDFLYKELELMCYSKILELTIDENDGNIGTIGGLLEMNVGFWENLLELHTCEENYHPHPLTL